MACVATVEFCKAASDVKEKGANLVVNFARRWAANTHFPADAPCRPATESGQTGLQYDPGSGGYSNGAIEPRWPKETSGSKSTVKDGSITWQAELLTVDSLHERIASVDWGIPDGIEFTEVPFVNDAFEQSIGGQWGGGTAGEVYSAEATVTTTRGNKKQVRFILTIDEAAA